MMTCREGLEHLGERRRGGGARPQQQVYSRGAHARVHRHRRCPGPHTRPSTLMLNLSTFDGILWWDGLRRFTRSDRKLRETTQVVRPEKWGTRWKVPCRSRSQQPAPRRRGLRQGLRRRHRQLQRLVPLLRRDVLAALSQGRL